MIIIPVLVDILCNPFFKRILLIDGYDFQFIDRLYKYKVIFIVASFLLTFSLMTLGWTDIENHTSYARCPNGSHKSPSGDCEAVVKSATKLPRCPNGFHRSPSGICESVNGSAQGNANNNPNNSGQKDTEPSNNSINPSDTSTNATAIVMKPLSDLPIGQCDESLWNHVYHPERLQIVDRCKTVSGVIESKKPEADGDFHIRLKLDSQFSNLINPANVNGQLGYMVVEPVCQKSITQLDAVQACSGFHQDINIPMVGSHVNVTGSYVLDREHDGWAEIHPVTSIVRIS